MKSGMRMMRVAVAAVAATLFMGGITQTAHAAPYAIDALNDSLYTPGEKGTIHGNCFKAGGVVTLTLEPGAIALGTLTAGEGDVLDGEFSIPDTVAPGKYTLVATGEKCAPAAGVSRKPHTAGKKLAFAGATQVMSFPIEVVKEKPAGYAAVPSLAVTGSNTNYAVSVGLALLTLGGIVLFGVRSRRGAKLAA